MDALPDTFPEPELVKQSMEQLVPYLVKSGGHWGVQDGDMWTAYAGWFIDHGLVTDSNDKVLTSLADLGTLYSNSLLPGS